MCAALGAFGWGYIACTGTNFMIRARALCHCGFFPEYTITEGGWVGGGGLFSFGFSRDLGQVPVTDRIIQSLKCC